MIPAPEDETGLSTGERLRAQLDRIKAKKLANNEPFIDPKLFAEARRKALMRTMTKSTTATTVLAGSVLKHQPHLSMTTSIRLALVATALWVLIALAVVLQNRYSSERIPDFLVGCAIPLSALWGVGWVIVGARKGIQTRPVIAPSQLAHSTSVAIGDDRKIRRRYRAVMVAGWVLAGLCSFHVFGRSNADAGWPVRLHEFFPYVLGASVMPLTAVVAGVSSFCKLRTIASFALSAYSIVLLVTLVIRIHG